MTFRRRPRPMTLSRCPHPACGAPCPHPSDMGEWDWLQCWRCGFGTHRKLWRPAEFADLLVQYEVADPTYRFGRS